MSAFVLHPRLAADTVFVTEGPLSRILLMNDSRFPWLILVPRLSAVELFDLDEKARGVLMEETARAGRVLKAWARSDKINTGSLGNVVPQLHMHVVGRKEGDAAWPGPVWGKGTAEPYAADAAGRIAAELAARLS